MKIRLLIICILLQFYTGEISAQDMSYNDVFLVCPCGREPYVHGLTDSGFAMSWWSDNDNFNSTYVYIQLYNNNGFTRGDIIIASREDGVEYQPKICTLANNHYLVYWSLNELYGQIFNQDWIKQGDRFQINELHNRGVFGHIAKALNDDMFLVCWSRKSGQNFDIYGQLFYNNGNKINSEFMINTDQNSEKISPAIASLKNDNFLVCWESISKNYLTYSVDGQLFYGDGTKKNSEFNIFAGDILNSSFNLCTLTESEFVICWVNQKENDLEPGVYGQFFNDNGNNIGTVFQISSDPSGFYINPSIKLLSNNNLVCSWFQLSGNIHPAGNIHIRMLSPEGKKLGTEFKAKTNSLVNEANFTLTNLLNNGFVIGWESFEPSAIYGIRYLDAPMIHQLKSFSLLEPTDDQTLISINYTFNWIKASSTHLNFPWELEYHIYLDEDDGFSSPTVIDSIYDTTYIVQNLTPGKTYFWKVLAKNIAGESLWSSETNTFFVSYDATRIKHQITNNKSQTFELYANYPNPFNPETTIRYNLPADQSVYPVKVKIYDALGRLIITFKDAQQNPGMHTVKWNGKNSAGQSMPSGIYFCVVEAGQFKAEQKMLLVR